MKESDAILIIRQAFSNTFSEDNFQKFAVNLFKNGYKQIDRSIVSNQLVRESFRDFVEEYKVLGSFEDNEKKKIDVLRVRLKRHTSLERARTAQRNFAADYLKNYQQGSRNSNGSDAALIAFIGENPDDWRFSLVKLEYSLEVKEGKVKTSEDLTPAKRWSFLVGKNEGSHTAQSRFLSLLKSDDVPNLRELEEAFNIEKVTNEFFKKYCELFLRMKESLDGLLEKDPQLKLDFESKEISTVDFAKKTLGQMAFLYFLQKKGWFGVKTGEDWGRGNKEFVRRLFEWRKEFSDYKDNFFNDILEPLFYEGLSSDHGNDNIYDRLSVKGQKYRMPFLNGGLFAPMNEYSWKTTEIKLPDKLFSNENRTKEGDTGDGILDVFDRYNFTVNENEPLEKEVAVDPEMLGKVFENLLEIRDRKSKGAFYTPREIVHYMCQESLINYLHSETDESIPREDIEMFIQKGIQIIQNDKTVLERGRETETYKYMLPESIRIQAMKLDSLLANIKVCDPAVGSGAFPLGMLNEIVRARQVLHVHINHFNPHYYEQLLKNAENDGIRIENEDIVYYFKYYAISHSIYGVDIDSGAVEIAKLRMWLALVVEEKVPHPLPNLEHKIMQGDSLLSEYEGIKLFDESLLDKSESQKVVQLGLNFGSTADRKLEELQHAVEAFIHESHKSEKDRLKAKIDTLKWELIEATLEEQERTDKLKKIQEERRKNIRPFFIWKLEFSDVFKEKGGFDVVIGNPPYVGEKGNKEIFRPIAQGNLGKYYQGKMDIFYFFFHLSLDIGRENSQNAFITTNYYITALGARKLRADLKNRSVIRNLINFNELRIFESALGQHNMITLFSKGNNEDIEAKTCITERTGTADEEILSTIVSGQDENTNYFVLSHKQLYDGEENYIRLGGVGNSDSPIDQILEKIKKQSETLANLCDINNGVHTQADYLTAQKFPKRNDNSAVIGSGIYILDENFLEDSIYLSSIKNDEYEKEYIKPFFKNSNIDRYFTEQTTTKKLIYLNKKIHKIESIPNIKEHLGRFRDIINDASDNAPYLHRPKVIPWASPKIVCPQRSKTNTFGYNEIPWYAASDVFFITLKKHSDTELKYILALLNSKLYYQWLFHRGKRKGQTLELIVKPLSEIPIKKILPADQKPFIDLVDQILATTSASDYDPKKPPLRQKELEAKIDEMVFDLYELTPEERETVLKS